MTAARVLKQAQQVGGDEDAEDTAGAQGQADLPKRNRHCGCEEAAARQMLNGSVPSSPTSPQDHALISTAEPAITVLQALIALTFVRTRHGLTAFALLFAAAFMRVVAQGLSFILPNDEARVSTWLGIGFWTLPILVSLALIACTIWASQRLGLTWRFNAMAYLVASLAVSAIVGADMGIGH
ncbi:hypothetical protein [Brevundimonas sp. PAMC22021]|uniref:hypothetical protein n=1 Tax=Brevundimonas sp. PAMC22021 TaxID=2861285 RepID=UPI001C6350A9|nr:hypothetical protein [Brevundimonas sp. PAMC22021]QYF87034.1 hypothetical protein KY493_00445 [Brevundimonas sp. PAMC22021]